MPLKDGRICVVARCVCGQEVKVCSGTYGTYCPACGKTIFTAAHNSELNEEIRKMVKSEKLKIRISKKNKSFLENDFSVGSSVFLSNCKECGSALNADSVFIVDGETVCRNCYENKVSRCKGCGERHFKQNMKNNLCEGCIVSFASCPNCGETYDRRRVRTFEVEGKTYCDGCVPTYLHQKGIIFDGYSRKPRPVFFGDKEVGIFFGVELEMDNSERRNEFMARSHTEEVYYKSDGSLGHGGCEMVTHPCTLDYHTTELPWQTILSAAKSCGYKSHMGTSGDRSSNSPTCGLHIHVNRHAFGKSPESRDKREAKLLLLFDKFWPQLSLFSRRDKTSLQRWAKRYADFDVPSEQLDAIIKKAKGENSGDRRYAVNFTANDGATVEFRLFRGTLQRETILASIQLINLFIEASKLTTERVQSLAWVEFCNDGCERYPEFAGYIARLRKSKKNI